MDIKEIKYIYVLGYGWSGSSAIIDLFKEFDGIVVPNLEFRLIKERYGIMNLETMLTNQWDPIETDIAIKDFLWLAKKLNERISRLYIHFGHCYQYTIGNHFLPTTLEYVEKLTRYKFKSTWHFFYWRVDVVKRVYYWLKKRFGLGDYIETMYFTKPMVEEEFENITKLYIDKLFEPLFSCSDDYLVLDQGVPPQYPELAFKYSKNAKVIVIDRDPRDVYVDLVNCGELIGAELSINDNANMFIEWYKSLHLKKIAMTNSKTDILFLNFEDLILDYDNTVAKIYNYLNIDENKHINKKTIFVPALSKKNIGIWKEYKNQDVMREIGKELGEYCYENK